MIVLPTKWGTLYASSATHTAREYGFARLQKHLPVPCEESQANQVARFFILGSQQKLARI
jgi:hypothetical protein